MTQQRARYRNATPADLYELSREAAARGDTLEARRLFDMADRRALAGAKPLPVPRMGRPPLPAHQRTESRSVRLTDARWNKLKALGLDWLSRQIDRADDPGAP